MIASSCVIYWTWRNKTFIVVFYLVSGRRCQKQLVVVVQLLTSSGDDGRNILTFILEDDRNYEKNEYF